MNNNMKNLYRHAQYWNPIPLPPKRISASERCVNSTSPSPSPCKGEGTAVYIKAANTKILKTF